MSHKKCALLFVQQLCKTELYFDNFWHEDTQMNFSSSACLIFFDYQKTVKVVDELKLRPIEAWSGIHQKSIVDQAID